MTAPITTPADALEAAAMAVVNSADENDHPATHYTFNRLAAAIKALSARIAPVSPDVAGLVDLVDEFVTATWHLMDNSETSGPVDDPTITVWHPDFDTVSGLLDRIEGLPSGSTEHLTAGELLAANIRSTITRLDRDLQAARGDVERLREALGYIESSRARTILPWTHEAAADEYSRMLDDCRHIARAALKGTSHE